MGEVRTKVKLTNATDEVLARRGHLKPSEVRCLEVEAVIDTGAVRSCMPLHVKQQLGLEAARRTTARYADGRLDDVELSEPVVLEILNRPTIEGFLVLGDEVLIGQTALETTDLLVDCTNRRVYPNPDHPDAVVVRIRHLP